jgi:hypothetical protein
VPCRAVERTVEQLIIGGQGGAARRQAVLHGEVQAPHQPAYRYGLRCVVEPERPHGPGHRRPVTCATQSWV